MCQNPRYVIKWKKARCIHYDSISKENKRLHLDSYLGTDFLGGYIKKNLPMAFMERLEGFTNKMVTFSKKDKHTKSKKTNGFQ